MLMNAPLECTTVAEVNVLTLLEVIGADVTMVILGPPIVMVSSVLLGELLCIIVWWKCFINNLYNPKIKNMPYLCNPNFQCQVLVGRAVMLPVAKPFRQFESNLSLFIPLEDYSFHVLWMNKGKFLHSMTKWSDWLPTASSLQYIWWPISVCS